MDGAKRFKGQCRALVSKPSIAFCSGLAIPILPVVLVAFLVAACSVQAVGVGFGGPPLRREKVSFKKRVTVLLFQATAEAEEAGKKLKTISG